MKWPILFIALVAIPLLAGWLRQNPGQTAKVWILMGVLLFVVDPLHLFMAVVSWPLWPGFVKGAEVSIIDVIALAIFISLPRSRESASFSNYNCGLFLRGDTFRFSSRCRSSDNLLRVATCASVSFISSGCESIPG